MSLSVTFLEVYNSEVRDLLHPGTHPKDINIREDTKGNILVVGAKALKVESVEDVLRSVERGGLQRTTGATLMNESSSRSHAIVTLTLQQCKSGKKVKGKE